METKEKELDEREQSFIAGSECIQNLAARERALSAKEKEFCAREQILAESEERFKVIASREVELSEKEKGLEEREAIVKRLEEEFLKKISAQEAELNVKQRLLDEREKALEVKENELAERALNNTKIASGLSDVVEVGISHPSAFFAARENERQSPAPSLFSVCSSFETANDELSFETINVDGINLRLSEVNRLFSGESERKFLIQEAGGEICNKWLQSRMSILQEKGRSVEKLIWNFVKYYFPYLGEKTCNLIVYDLHAMRVKRNNQ